MWKTAPVSAWRASGYVWEELTQGLLVPPGAKKKKNGTFVPSKVTQTASCKLLYLIRRNKFHSYKSTGCASEVDQDGLKFRFTSKVRFENLWTTSSPQLSCQIQTMQPRKVSRVNAHKLHICSFILFAPGKCVLFLKTFTGPSTLGVKKYVNMLVGT
jgi:hypothetical protein